MKEIVIYTLGTFLCRRVLGPNHLGPKSIATPSRDHRLPRNHKRWSHANLFRITGWELESVRHRWDSRRGPQEIGMSSRQRPNCRFSPKSRQSCCAVEDFCIASPGLVFLATLISTVRLVTRFRTHVSSLGALINRLLPICEPGRPFRCCAQCFPVFFANDCSWARAWDWVGGWV